MIVRGGRRTVTDMGPSPAHVDSHYSFNTNAIASEPFVAPVERRFLNPIELARIHEQEPVPYLPPVTVAERAAAMAVARSRGGQATARIRTPKPAVVRRNVMGRPVKFTDADLFAALLANHGSQARAATALGVSRSGVKRRVRHLRAAGSVPPAVAAILRGPGGWWRWDRAAA